MYNIFSSFKIKCVCDETERNYRVYLWIVINFSFLHIYLFSMFLKMSMCYFYNEKKIYDTF